MLCNSPRNSLDVFIVREAAPPSFKDGLYIIYTTRIQDIDLAVSPRLFSGRCRWHS